MENTNTLKLKILNENELKNCQHDKPIAVKLEAIYFRSDALSFRWESMGKSTTTRGKKMQLTFPAWYCGNEIEIKVSVIKKATAFLYNAQLTPFPPVNPDIPLPVGMSPAVYPQQSLLPEILQASERVTPQCPVKFISLEWQDRNYNPIEENTPLIAGEFYMLSINVAGLNNREVEGYFYTKHYPVDPTAKPVSVTVKDNMLFFYFYADKRFLEDQEEIDLQFKILDDKNQLPKSPYTEKIKLLPESQTVKPLDSFPLQPLLVGTIDIVENNFHPCKYTKIEVTGEPKTGDNKVSKIVFNESRNVAVTPINLIGGKNNVKILLSEYNTKTCKIKGKGSHKENNQAVLIKYGAMESRAIAIPNNGEFGLDLEYDYSTFTKLIPLAALKYLFPYKEDFQQRHTLQIDTCRHSKKIEFVVVPDIKWEAGFEVQLSPDMFTHRNFTPGVTFQRAQEKASETGRETSFLIKFGKTTATVGLVLGCEFNDENNVGEYGSDIAEKIKNFINLIVKIRETVRSIFAFAQGNLNDKETSDNKIARTVGGLPMSFEVLMPNLEVLASWQNKLDKTNQLYTYGELNINASPLIGARVSVDLWQVATKGVPLILFIQDAIDHLGETLTAEVSMPFSVTGEFNVNLAKFSFNSRDEDASVHKGGLDGNIKIALDVHLKAGIKVVTQNFTTVAQVMAEAGLSAAFKGEANIGYDNQGFYFEPIISFGGLYGEVKIEAEFSIKVKVKEWRQESDTKGSQTWKSAIIEAADIYNGGKIHIFKKIIIQ